MVPKQGRTTGLHALHVKTGNAQHANRHDDQGDQNLDERKTSLVLVGPDFCEYPHRFLSL